MDNLQRSDALCRLSIDVSGRASHPVTMEYGALDSERILSTLTVLEKRISDRFPDSSLRKVCSELVAISRKTQEQVNAIARPNFVMRSISVAIVLVGLALIGYLASIIDYKRETENLFGVLGGIEALLNTVVLMGAGIFFIATMEGRLKRQHALDDLHELRSIVHVIDMHQLTKDPRVLREDQLTPSSPERRLSTFELTRYLDYCTEMLSLTAKVAALYAQSARDPAVLGAVSELETVSANLSYKIWQKIMIIQSDENTADLKATVDERRQVVARERGVSDASAGHDKPAASRMTRGEPT